MANMADIYSRAAAELAPAKPKVRYIPTADELAESVRYLLAHNWQRRDARAFDRVAAYLAARRARRTVKGLFLFGPKGTGKTMLLEALAKPGTVHVWTERELLDQWELDHHYLLERMECKGMYGIRDIHELYLDDVGYLPQSVQYGNRAEVVAEVIDARYRLWRRTPDRTLYLTSNMTPAVLGERYGAHLESRLAEMCIPVEFTGPDQRKAEPPAPTITERD